MHKIMCVYKVKGKRKLCRGPEGTNWAMENGEGSWYGEIARGTLCICVQMSLCNVAPCKVDIAP